MPGADAEVFSRLLDEGVHTGVSQTSPPQARHENTDNAMSYSPPNYPQYQPALGPTKKLFEPLIPLALASTAASFVATGILAHLALSSWGKNYQNLPLEILFYGVFVLVGIISGAAIARAGNHVGKSYVILLVTILFQLLGFSIILLFIGLAIFPFLAVPALVMVRAPFIVLALSVPYFVTHALMKTSVPPAPEPPLIIPQMPPALDRHTALDNTTGEGDSGSPYAPAAAYPQAAQQHAAPSQEPPMTLDDALRPPQNG